MEIIVYTIAFIWVAVFVAMAYLTLRNTPIKVGDIVLYKQQLMRVCRVDHQGREYSYLTVESLSGQTYLAWAGHVERLVKD